MKFRVHAFATEHHHYSLVIEAKSDQDAENIADAMDLTDWFEHDDGSTVNSYIGFVEEVEDE